MEQAIKIKDTDKAVELFEKSVNCYKEWLQLTEQLSNEQNRIEEQIKALSWLVRCYFSHRQKKNQEYRHSKRPIQTGHYTQRRKLQLAEQLEDKLDDSIQEQIKGPILVLRLLRFGASAKKLRI